MSKTRRSKSHSAKLNKPRPYITTAKATPPPSGRLIAMVGAMPQGDGARRLVFEESPERPGAVRAVLKVFHSHSNGWFPREGTMVFLSAKDVERLAYALADALPPSPGAAEVLADLEPIETETREPAPPVSAVDWTHRPATRERLASFKRAMGGR